MRETTSSIDRDALRQAPGTIEPLVELDLSVCDREPIQVPGSIQPHGFLLALDYAGVVCIASANAAQFLQIALPEIFGRSLSQLLGAETGGSLERELAAESLGEATRLLVGRQLPAAGVDAPESRPFFDIIAFQGRQGDALLTCLEFELLQAPADIAAINDRLYNFVAAIRRVPTTAEVCAVAVDEIQALTGFDRVLLYRFDEEGNGVVLAEQRRHADFASYLGLRFPASDIPAQARRLYEINRIRIIPDVDYEASPLLDAQGPAPALDLSGSILRSVSPVHRQYMRNMGTACSMSVSIIIDGKLWGMVSCHHREPRYVPLRLRSACDFVVQIVASQLESQQNGLHLTSALRARSVQNHLLAGMASQESYVESLRENSGLLAELVQADGVAIVAGMGVHRSGHTPSEAEVLQLAAWLRTRHEEDMFAAHNLAAVFAPAAEYTEAGSGVIAMAISKLHNTQVLWFRQELVQIVRWAGNPQKAAEPVAGTTGELSPRHSFEEWSETVRGCSSPWSAEELEAAKDFRSAVLTIVLRRAEELAEMAADLQIANEELEAFSYSVSHDLRAPFRHISGFSQMLKEEEAAHMGERGKRYLETIMESAQFAGQLVNSLLEFARIARYRLTLAPVSMERLVDSEWNAVLNDEGRQRGNTDRAVEFSRGPLPDVMGDAYLLRQVLHNFLSNALKYTGRQQHARVRVEAAAQEQEFIFSIADNGVGFDQQYAGKLFGVFQRLHRMEDFEGTGIGLANARRIVGRHGGRTWAEGAVGLGATFYFTLPASFPGEQA